MDIKEEMNMNGGMTTSQWGEKTWGAMGQQVAQPGSNVIATKGGNPLAAVMSPEVMTPIVLTLTSNQAAKLLRQSKSRKFRGGDLTQVAVPALLVIANNMAAKKLRTAKKSGRRNRTFKK
jgi:hypothetical protein